MVGQSCGHGGHGTHHTLPDGHSDVNGDVDFTDYVVVKVNFGNSLSKGEASDQASVPEPGTAALLALGALLLLVARVAWLRTRR